MTGSAMAQALCAFQEAVAAELPIDSSDPVAPAAAQQAVDRTAVKKHN
jgi:hypothetical protein